MLSMEHRAIIKATVPVLEEGGEALTTHFYRILLQQHPQLRPLFNPANQASGAQPRALANAVLLYARHIDRLDALGGLVGQIVNKHVALQIQPEHYSIVGGCLLQAIAEVLGSSVATPAVLDAWAAAYGQLADLLMGLEEDLYQANATAPGGWQGARAFRLERREAESEVITSFYLKPVDERPVLIAKPGQYVGVQQVIDGVEHRRNYSLSALSDGHRYRISIKREAGGVVSRYLHDRLQIGDTLNLFPPAGDFVLTPGDQPLVLISGGVGITPTLAMLEAALKTSRAVRFIHCARNRSVHAFRRAIDDLAAQYPHLERFYCYSQPEQESCDASGPLDADLLNRWLPEDRDLDVYLLGPSGFMRSVRAALVELGVPAARCRYEWFGPAQELN